MKVLALVAEQRLPNNDALYEALGKECQLTVVKLNKKAQENISKAIKIIDINNFDRVIFDVHFKRIYKQYKLIRKIPNLVIFEEDACQNYIPNSKWQNRFLKFYQSLTSFRLVCTGVNLSHKFKAEGLDACFLQKGYDHTQIKHSNGIRDIELGFIGRTKSATYAEREQLLTALKDLMGLSLLRTEPGQEYVDTLNRIRFFVSADIGLTEYMAKNFEAMACGCVVFAYRQGIEEEEQGLVDMENIVLYSDIDELKEKIALLKVDSIRADKIAQSGLELVEKNHSFEALAQRFYQLLEPEITPLPAKPNWQKWLPF